MYIISTNNILEAYDPEKDTPSHLKYYFYKAAGKSKHSPSLLEHMEKCNFTLEVHFSVELVETSAFMWLTRTGARSHCSVSRMESRT